MRFASLSMNFSNSGDSTDGIASPEAAGAAAATTGASINTNQSGGCPTVRIVKITPLYHWPLQPQFLVFSHLPFHLP